MNDILFYRPEWVCGRYDKCKKATIAYNLIAGKSYFFEDESAEVVGAIISIPRNEKLSLQSISEKTMISVESLLPFIKQLINLHLLIEHPYTKEEVLNYRHFIYQQRLKQESEIQKTSTASLDNAERDYSEKVEGITSVMLELTYQCSEKCIHCYNPGAVRNPNEKNKRGDREQLTLDEYKRIIDEFYEQGLVKVCLSGGDPFSNPLAWDIIEYLYKKEIVFDVFTNGQMIVHDVERLADYYPRLIGISIYSGTAEVHDAITQKRGSWKRSMEVVKQLSLLAVPMNLKCCIMVPNVQSYHEVSDLAKKYGTVPQFDLNITDSLDGDKCASLYLRLPKDLMEIVLRDKDLPYYTNEKGVSRETAAIPSDKVCGAGLHSFCVTPEGFLEPCCSFPILIGNLRDTSLKKILAENVLKLWQSRRLKDFSDCYKHDYCIYCQMCPGNNYSSNGNPLKPAENNCMIAKTRYDLVQKIKQGKDPLHGKNVKETLQQVSINLHPLYRQMATNYRTIKNNIGDK